MQPPQQHSLINLAEIKSQLIKKLGVERSKQYFDYLNRFLSLKLSKAEFDKLCLKTIGKDNIQLHNQLIQSVLKNAYTRTVGNKKLSDGKVHHQNGALSFPAVPQVTSPLALSNGDILPPSPRKPRTVSRDRKTVDRRSTLAPNGKTNHGFISSSNGDSLHHQELMQHNKEGKDVSDRISLHAPLGVPFCPVGMARVLPNGSGSNKCVGDLHIEGLLDTPTIKKHMEEIAASQGLQRVSMDCANVTNNGLDAYLKRLIRSCAQINGSRSVNLNPNAEPKPESKRIVTLLDFRVAMELNCKQLGEDWPIVLEKICAQAFEEQY